MQWTLFVAHFVRRNLNERDHGKLRVSQVCQPLKHSLIVCSVFDVVGILARDLKAMRELVGVTFDLKSSRKYPAKILYPTEFFPHSNAQQQAMVDEYVSVLESFLGTKKTVFSLAERWSQCAPTEAEGLGLRDYLGSVSRTLEQRMILTQPECLQDSMLRVLPYLQAISRLIQKQGQS
jgi:hypothetical protein